MSTIFEAIRADHEKQRDLISRLVKTKGASEDRESIYAELKAQLTAHAAAEERFFYNPLIEHDVTQEHARHSVSEHKELDDFIKDLDSYEMTAPQWLLTAKELKHRLLHHLDEEEKEIFPLAGKVLVDDSKDRLADAYAEDMERHLGGHKQKVTDEIVPSVL